jgi:hypothetical protein
MVAIVPVAGAGGGGSARSALFGTIVSGTMS